MGQGGEEIRLCTGIATGYGNDMDEAAHRQRGIGTRPVPNARPEAGSARTLLLHVCCGPCATHAIDWLRREYVVTLFFSNSNIWPPSEYALRLEQARKLALACGTPLIEDDYDHEAWRAFIHGLEDEPERGRRCARCFEFNLIRTARVAAARGCDCFTTTLTTSPHKDARTIFSIGHRLGPFLAVDLKKQNGFLHSLALSRDYGLYRQDYCGCEWSRRPGEAERAPDPAS